MRVGRQPRTTRGKGEGSIYQRADGYWVGAVEVPRGIDGKRRRKRVVRRYKRDVVNSLAELKRQTDDGIIPDRNSTVSQILHTWLDDVAPHRVKASSLVEYRKRVDRIEPLLGRIRLSRLTVPMCQAAVADLQDRYAPKTTRGTVDTLKAALDWAVAAGMLTRNPAENVVLARKPRTKVDDSLTADEARRVIDAAAGHRLEGLVKLALIYGLRIGELVGLDWAAVDFTKREFTVSKSKTDAGIRTIPMIDDAEDILRALAKANGHPAAGPVFVTGNGTPWLPQRVRDQWNDILRSAQIEHKCRNCGSDDKCTGTIRRFHCSRHTAATLMIERGVPLEIVSAILGHSSISITADIYAKIRADLQRRHLAPDDPDQQVTPSG